MALFFRIFSIQYGVANKNKLVGVSSFFLKIASRMTFPEKKQSTTAANNSLQVGHTAQEGHLQGRSVAGQDDKPNFHYL